MHYNQEVKEVMDSLQTTEDGLGERELNKRLEEYGPNQLDKGKTISPVKIFFEQFKSTVVFILIVATVISAILNEWIDAIAIFIILILNAILGFVQEYKAERAIEALERMAAPKATVVRSGKMLQVDSKEVVPGDILILDTGAKIPADARLIECSSLEVQEAALTGESLPVKKNVKPLKGEIPVGDRKNMVFSGTVITKGKGRAVVVSTGMKTEMGKIAGMIQTAEDDMTPLQKKLDALGRKLGYLTIVVCAIVYAAGIFQGQPPIHMFLTAVALAVAAIPEGLPAVITISLAFGVHRMLDKNALIRKLPSVETLGSTTVICTDKTGTLTHNQMTVTKAYSEGKVVDVSGRGYEPAGKIEGQVDPLLFRIGALCNDAQLEESSWEVIGDPTEGCLLTSARKAGMNEHDLLKEYERVGEVPFDSTRKRMTTVHKSGKKFVAYSKGAPDVLIQFCTKKLENGKVTKLTQKERDEILKANEKFTNSALRVLAFAYREGVEEQEEYDYTIEKDMVFVGLQAMIDPPREEVKEAIKRCKTAGIKVIMVTGDHISTALAIARELGIEGDAVEGKDVDNMNLEAKVNNIGVFARVSPEHKLKIVEALKNKGHIVAMTGDGVNDAPALKKADIGIAMGITGTDVAKEASEMVLTDDNFASIVNAIEEGRGIFDNIKKFVNYLLSSNFGEVLVLFVAMLIGFTDADGNLLVPLIAIQILWINLVTDSLPALALGVDPPEHEIMTKKPRDPSKGIITKNMALNIFLVGIMICAATLFLFTEALPNAREAQTVALTTLVMMEIVRLQMIRQSYHIKINDNKWLIFSIFGVLVLQVLAMYTPLSDILKIVPLTFMEWVYIAIVCAGMYAIGIVASHYIKEWTHERD